MRKITLYASYVLAMGVALYAVVAYGLFPLGDLVHPLMKKVFQQHAAVIYIHVFCSALALALGPLQFSGWLRQNHIRIHRWLGRVYLTIGVLPGSISGLYIAQFAFGGWLSHSGFSLLACAWMFTGVMAYLAIRRKDIVRHQQWMIGNYALTFAAVTLRIYLGLFMAAEVRFEVFYAWLAWLCWLPNVLVALWLARKVTTPNNHICMQAQSV